MAEHSRNGDTPAGEADSSGGLWGAFRRLFEEEGDASLRERLEEAIDADEENGRGGPGAPGTGDLSPVERVMLKNLLHFSDHDADDIAIPRGEIIAIPDDAPWEALVALFAEHGVSRVPVYRDSLDEVVGMMHVKDVFAHLARHAAPPADWTQLMRQPLFVPQARRALDVLADMRTRRTHLAIVVDEFSGTDGIITIEDLVEEIVGEIEDEHDEAPVALVVPVADGIWEADARAELDDVAELVGETRVSRRWKRRSTRSAVSPSCSPNRCPSRVRCSTTPAAGGSRLSRATRPTLPACGCMSPQGRSGWTRRAEGEVVRRVLGCAISLSAERTSARDQPSRPEPWSLLCAAT